MKKILFSFLFSGFITIASAQLPTVNNNIMVQTTINQTVITVNYKHIVANEILLQEVNTNFKDFWHFGYPGDFTLNFSTPVLVNNQAIKPGTYALSARNNKSENYEIRLTLIQPKSEKQKKKTDDATTISFYVNAQKTDVNFPNYLSANFVNHKIYQKSLLLSFGSEYAFEFPIEFRPDEDFRKLSIAHFENFDKKQGDPYFIAAKYILDADIKTEEGLEWSKKNLNKRSGWEAFWVRAQTLAFYSQFAEAIAMGQEAVKKYKTDVKPDAFLKAQELYLMEQKIALWQSRIKN